MTVYFKDKFEVEVIYEDDVCVVFNKPAPLYSVKINDCDTVQSLASKILVYAPEMSTVSNKPEDAGLLQRLDGDTSGCILAAKTKDAWEALFNSLKDGDIHKQYIAICEGQLTECSHVENYLGSKYRHSHKVKIFKNANTPRTLKAVSDFEPLALNRVDDLSLVLGSAPTARRHQIRAHLAYLGYPLFGDALYGAKKQLNSDNGRGFLLHAYSLNFKLPFNSEIVNVTAPLPDEIRNYFGDEVLTSLSSGIS